MKATYFGICQLCQSTQKLPGGRIAVHGYTVDYGFFHGICRGSGELPLNESVEFLKSVRDGRAEVAAAFVAAPEPAAPTWQEQRSASREQHPHSKWALAQQEQRQRLQFVAFANAVIKAWTPRPLVPVIEEIAAKQSASDKRTGLRDAARRRDAAKRELSRAVEALNAFAEVRERDDLRALPRATSHESHNALPEPERKALEKAVKVVIAKWSPYQASNVSRAGKAAAAVLAHQTDERWVAAAREVDRLNADYLAAVSAHAGIAG